MKKEILQEHINNRQIDVQSYQINIDNYTSMLKLLPTECPEHLVEFRNKPIDQILNLPFEDIQIISDLQFRTKIEGMLIMEKLEQRKSQYVLDSMLLQLKEINDVD